jgi:hypothetical protein
MDIGTQIIWLFVLAIPVASISWTITHEEVFREPRIYFTRKSLQGRTLVVRKFFYMLTCEYCFSHYITILIVALCNYKLLLEDWRGYGIGGFSMVWIANLYMSLYGFLRIDMKKEKIMAKKEEKSIK